MEYKGCTNQGMSMKEYVDSITDYAHEARMLSSKLNTSINGPKIEKACTGLEKPCCQVAQLQEIRDILMELCTTLRDLTEQVG